MTSPEWRHPLPSPPPGARLEEAWLTTYDRPDASLLVERFLPALLGARSSIGSEGLERRPSFAELVDELERRRHQLTILSSPSRERLVDDPYPWLWRYVAHVSVGARGPAVQHAKLWAFHWSSDDGNEPDQLELHVSSTNLTLAAFRAQVQAGWRCLLPLDDTTQAREKPAQEWSSLVKFLRALGESAGDDADLRLQRLVALLGRARCPDDAHFIASIPGKPSPLPQLAKHFAAQRLHVFVPTVGEWSAEQLQAWCGALDLKPKHLTLAWIEQGHAWSSKAGWALTQRALDTLRSQGAALEALREPPGRGVPQAPRDPPALHRDQETNDDRWSHAKLYVFHGRGHHRVLVTSANFSVSAWGAGKTAPRNFELGVLVPGAVDALDHLDECATPFLVDRLPPEVAPALHWAAATWDGVRVLLEAKSTDTLTPIEAHLSFERGEVHHASLVEGRAELPCADAQNAPRRARFVQGADALDVDVLDRRSDEDFGRSPWPELTPEEAEELSLALLLQRYGGPVVEADVGDAAGEPRGGRGATDGANYSVKAWVESRKAFAIVDCWRSRLKRAEEQQSRSVAPLLADGRRLQAHFARRTQPALAQVSDELGWRIELSTGKRGAP
jgi:hypothetical protein